MKITNTYNKISDFINEHPAFFITLTFIVALLLFFKPIFIK